MTTAPRSKRASERPRAAAAETSLQAIRASLPADAQLYVAAEAARRYGAIEPDLARKLRRNLRRRLATTLPLADIDAFARHCKQIYAYGAEVLPTYLRPIPAGTYVDPADVDRPALLRDLRSRFPDEAATVIEGIAWYVVFYEYLK